MAADHPGDDHCANELSGLVLTQDQQDPKKWTFQAVWNQQLSRTQALPHKEAYGVCVYATSQGITHGPVPDEVRLFEVMTMAKPVNASIPYEGRYDEQSREGTVWTKAQGSQGVWLTLPYTSSGPHLAVDYAASPGAWINAAEYGTVQEPNPDFIVWNQGAFIQPIGVVDSILAAINQWMQSRGFSGDPWVYLQASSQAETWFNDNNLGPNREVHHDKVNIIVKDATKTTPDEQYDRGTTYTKYCHIQLPKLVPPAAGQDWDISEHIATVGAWDQNQLLGLGYFYAQNVTIHIEPKPQYKQNPNEVLGEWLADLAGWPSITGPHLHFEVNVTEKKDSFRQRGQQNPNDWVYLGFGQKQ